MKRTVCLILTIVFLMLGSNQPATDQGTNRLSPIWFILDVSRSMYTTDGDINRLETSKTYIQEVGQSTSDRPHGLIAFAGESTMIVPPTYDSEYFLQRLDELEYTAVNQGGSNLIEVIHNALNRRQIEANSVLLIFTDGDIFEDRQNDSFDSIMETLNENRIQLILMGIGDSSKENPIQLLDGEILTKFNDKPMIAPFDPEKIKRIADRIGCQYYLWPKWPETNNLKVDFLTQDLELSHQDKTSVLNKINYYLVLSFVAFALFITSNRT